MGCLRDVNREDEERCEISKRNRGGVLFLTNNSNALNLYDWLSAKEDVSIYSDRLELEMICDLRPELIVSYNYRYIISEDIIEYMNGRVINLHISFLPWNRGSSPNLWSFIDNTPKGVTIHQINAGLDTGKILYQKKCCFNESTESFSSSYQKLNDEIVGLFKEKWEEIRSGRYESFEQSGEGSYHSKKDLDLLKSKIDLDWNDNIAEFLERYHAVENSEPIL